MANFLDTIDAKTLEEIKSRDEEYIILRKQAAELKMMKEKLRQAEFEQLKQEVNECKTKLNNITKAKIKDMLHKFFEEHIVSQTGSTIKTVDVMTKANEVLASHKLRFTKFEVAQFMKDRGISKKKGANHTFYVDVKFV